MIYIYAWQQLSINGPIILEKVIEARRGGEAIETLNRLSLFTKYSGFDPLISKLTRIINQGRKDKMRQSSINNFFK